MSLRGTGQGGALSRAAEAVQVLGGAGFLNPAFLGTLIPAMRKFGSTGATGFSAAAARKPDDIAIIDERGMVTFGELDTSTNAIARGLKESVDACSEITKMIFRIQLRRTACSSHA